MRFNLNVVFRRADKQSCAEIARLVTRQSDDDLRCPDATRHGLVRVIRADCPDVGIMTIDADSDTVSPPGEILKFLKGPRFRRQASTASFLCPGNDLVPGRFSRLGLFFPVNDCSHAEDFMLAYDFWHARRDGPQGIPRGRRG